MIKLFLFFAFSLSLLFSSAQSKGTILGVVSDLNSEEPLPFVKVFVEDTETGAVTSFDGKYKIDSKGRSFIHLINFFQNLMNLSVKTG